MIDIKSYAEQKGVTTQAVYKQINTHKETLKGHIQKVNGKRWLDDEAVDFLNKQSANSAPAIFSEAESKTIEALKEQVTFLQAKVVEQAEKIASQVEELRASDKALSEVNVLLLNSAKEKERADVLEAQNADLSIEVENKDKELEELKERLKTVEIRLINEQSRALTFKEWRERRKNK